MLRRVNAFRPDRAEDELGRETSAHLAVMMSRWNGV